MAEKADDKRIHPVRLDALRRIRKQVGLEPLDVELNHMERLADVPEHEWIWAPEKKGENGEKVPAGPGYKYVLAAERYSANLTGLLGGCPVISVLFDLIAPPRHAGIIRYADGREPKSDYLKAFSGLTLPAGGYLVTREDQLIRYVSTAKPGEEEPAIEICAGAWARPIPLFDGEWFTFGDYCNMRATDDGGLEREAEAMGRPITQPFSPPVCISHIPSKRYDAWTWPATIVGSVSRVDLKTAYHPISKVTKQLTDPDLFAEEISLDTSRAGRRTKFTKVSLAYSDPKTKLSEPLTEYDKCVLAALATIYEEIGSAIFTPRQGCQAMGIEHPTKKQEERFLRSMYKMRGIVVHIDMTLETAAKGLELESDLIDGPLVDFRRRQARAANGRGVDAITLLARPITYEHAKKMNQVATFPIRYLQFGVGSATEKNQILRRMVLERVMELRNPKSGISNHIRITRDPKNPERAIEIEGAGVDVFDTDDRRQAARFMCSVLDDLKHEKRVKGHAIMNDAGRPATGRGAEGQWAYIEISV